MWKFAVVVCALLISWTSIAPAQESCANLQYQLQVLRGSGGAGSSWDSFILQRMQQLGCFGGQTQSVCPAGTQYCGGSNQCCNPGFYCSRYGCIAQGSIECGGWSCSPGQQCSRGGGCVPQEAVDCGRGRYCKDGNVCWAASADIPGVVKKGDQKCAPAEIARKLDERIAELAEQKRREIRERAEAKRRAKQEKIDAARRAKQEKIDAARRAREERREAERRKIEERNQLIARKKEEREKSLAERKQKADEARLLAIRKKQEAELFRQAEARRKFQLELSRVATNSAKSREDRRNQTKAQQRLNNNASNRDECPIVMIMRMTGTSEREIAHTKATDSTCQSYRGQRRQSAVQTGAPTATRSPVNAKPANSVNIAQPNSWPIKSLSPADNPPQGAPASSVTSSGSQNSNAAPQVAGLVTGFETVPGAAQDRGPVTREVALATLPYALMARDAYEGSGSSFAPVGYKRDVDWWQSFERAGVSKQQIKGIAGSGFSAIILRNETTKEIAIAYRGTDASSIVDWSSDAAARLKKNSESRLIISQYTAASDLAKHIIAQNPSYSVTLTGHSLGGALAAYAGDKNDNKVVTFNAARNLYSTGKNPNQTNIVVMGDVVGDQVGALSLIAGNGSLAGDTYKITGTSGDGIVLRHGMDGIVGGLSDSARHR